MNDYLRRAAQVWLVVAGLGNADLFALDKVATYKWDELKSAGQLLSGSVEAGPNETSVLKVTAEAGRPLLPLVVLRNPAVSKRFYVVSGRCRVEGAGSAGYLEMWNVLSDQQRFFTRTLAQEGPMRQLVATSEWRDFALPASLLESPEAPLPKALELNVSLPAGGTVYLSDLTLSQGDMFEFPAATGAWWGPRTSGLVGGLLGGGIGCLAGLAGWLAARPAHRELATRLFVTIAVTAAPGLIAGFAALALRQPYEVWFPLLLVGVLGVAIPLVQLRILRQQRVVEELRRLEAVDVG